MKKYICALILVVISLGVFTACSGNSKPHPFGGTFFTEEGIRFQLNADSTTVIQFDDTLKYEGTWKIRKDSNNIEYATIEFAGYPDYYLLRNQKLYRSEREMHHDNLGLEITYESSDEK